MNAITLQNRRYGVKVILDPNQIFPGDPGQGTPVLIELSDGSTGTWACWEGEGEVDGAPVTTEQQSWLEDQRAQVEAWCEAHNC